MLTIKTDSRQEWMDREPQIDSLVEGEGTQTVPTLEKDSEGITL